MIIDRQTFTMDDVLQALDKRLTLGENLQAIQIGISDTGPVDTEFTVQHNMGKTPRQYIYNIDSPGIVYDSRRSSWTTSEMFLKCSIANAQLTITVL